MQPGDVRHDIFIGQCNRCRAIYVQHDFVTNSFGVALTMCQHSESDEQLRQRIGKVGPGKNYIRGHCDGQLVRVDHPDVAEAAFRTGGIDAVLVLLGLPMTSQYTISRGMPTRGRTRDGA